MRPLVLLLLFVCLLGCGSKDPESGSTSGSSPTVASSSGPKAEDQLYEELRSGAFQLAAATGSLEEAIEIVRKSKVQFSSDEQLVAAMADISDALDSAGASISDFTEAPEAEDVRGNFKSYDDMRLKAIEGSNDCLRDLSDASAVVDSLLEDGKHGTNENLKQLQGVLEVAQEDVRSALEAMGGKAEE